jgi:hypothetical protein
MANLNQKVAYRDHQDAAAAGSTAEVNLTVQEPYRRVFVSHVAAKNNTSAAATCYVYIRSGGALYNLTTLTLTTAGTWYSDKVQVWVYAGEELNFAFSAVSASDRLVAAACGEAEYVAVTAA